MADQTKNFNLDETDIEYVQRIAKENGNCSDSAALRIIIREHCELISLAPASAKIASKLVKRKGREEK